MQTHPGATAPTKAIPPDLMGSPDALMRLRAVCAMVSLSRSTVYQKIKDGTFPSPAVKLGARCTRWRAGDVHEWVMAPR